MIRISSWLLAAVLVAGCGGRTAASQGTAEEEQPQGPSCWRYTGDDLGTWYVYQEATCQDFADCVEHVGEECTPVCGVLGEEAPQWFAAGHPYKQPVDPQGCADIPLPTDR